MSILYSNNSKYINDISLDRKTFDLDFDTLFVKLGRKLTELFVVEDTIPLFADTRWFDLCFRSVESG